MKLLAGRSETGFALYGTVVRVTEIGIALKWVAASAAEI